MRPKGLEPPAHCLEGSCSIQLSYQTDLVVNDSAKIRIIFELMKSDSMIFSGTFKLYTVTFVYINK